MIVHNLDTSNSVLNHFISEIRDVNVQKDSMRFRRNIERIGEILSYEMSRELEFQTNEVQTPLGLKDVPCIADKLVLCSVLRAGLPLHQGVLNYFDQIENAFISASKKFGDTMAFNIWIAASQDIFRSEPVDVDIWSTLPEKKFRDAIAYRAGDKLKNFLERKSHE